jgi:hypothetical protein
VGGGIALRAARRRAGLTPGQAAHATGVPLDVYRSAEAGQGGLDAEAYGQAFATLASLPENHATAAAAQTKPARHANPDTAGASLGGANPPTGPRRPETPSVN